MTSNVTVLQAFNTPKDADAVQLGFALQYGGEASFFDDLNGDGCPDEFRISFDRLAPPRFRVSVMVAPQDRFCHAGWPFRTTRSEDYDVVTASPARITKDPDDVVWAPGPGHAGIRAGDYVWWRGGLWYVRGVAIAWDGRPVADGAVASHLSVLVFLMEPCLDFPTSSVVPLKDLAEAVPVAKTAVEETAAGEALDALWCTKAPFASLETCLPRYATNPLAESLARSIAEIDVAHREVIDAYSAALAWLPEGVLWRGEFLRSFDPFDEEVLTPLREAADFYRRFAGNNSFVQVYKSTLCTWLESAYQIDNCFGNDGLVNGCSDNGLTTWDEVYRRTISPRTADAAGAAGIL